MMGLIHRCLPLVKSIGGYARVDNVKNKTMEQLSKLDEVDMEYIVNFLGGLGGHGYGLHHAQESARVINQLYPTMIQSVAIARVYNNSVPVSHAFHTVVKTCCITHLKINVLQKTLKLISKKSV